MSDENIGIISALWRFVSFWRLRKALGLVRAADAQFTGSVQGIRDAYDLHREKLITQYKELEGAISQMEMVLEEQRQQLDNLNKREEELLRKREGALTLFEQAQGANDSGEMAKHKAAFDRFDAEIQRGEEQQRVLEGQISESDKSMQGFLQQLTALQAEIQRLPREKAEQIASFVSSQKIVELNNRLRGLQSSLESGPIEAVRRANAELTARARVSSKIAGTDVHRQDADYDTVGRSTSSGDRMQQMLAARKAEKEAKTGEKPAETKTERPVI
jgi:chromosome segregation ATPase